MSGTAGSNVLREYLVNLKYQVDAAGKRNFVNSLTEIAGRILGSKAGILGLATALVLMTKRLAEASEQLYFMSQRTQTSATNIQSATDAMTRFGISAEGAHGALEAFSSWQRSQGPAATLFLRSLGVNAGDATEQMAQLGQVLQRMGGRIGQEGTLGYALALQTAQMAGLNETAFRALIDPNLPAQIARSRQLLLEASGLDEAGTQQMTTNAHEVMNAFRDYGTIFEGFSNAFRATLFPAVLPALKDIFKVIRDNREAIRNFLVETARLIGALATGLATLIHLFSEFPTAVKLIVGGLAALALGLGRFALALLSTPFGWFLAGLTMLLILLEDYATWKKGQEQGTGADTMFDWGNIDKIKKMTPMDVLKWVLPNWGPMTPESKKAMEETNRQREEEHRKLMQTLSDEEAAAEEKRYQEQLAEEKRLMDEADKQFKAWLTDIFWWVIRALWERVTQPQGRDGAPQPTDTPPGVGGGGLASAAGPEGQAFYDETYNSIYRAAQARGLPNPDVLARVGAAQAVEETGWGQHMVGNNVFGIKGPGVMAMTSEFENGQMVRKPQSFRAYASRADSIADYVDFLASNPRFAGLLNARTPEQGFAAVGGSRYATNPNYGRNITAIDAAVNARRATAGGPLRSRPLVPAGPGLGASQRNDVSMNQTTSITVSQGPTATDTAAAVAREQARVNEGLIRDTTAAMA